MHDDLVYDVGANNGDDTAYYLHKGFRVLAIEADPVQAGALQQRFRSEVDSGRLTILNVAIAPRDGDARFWVCETHLEWCSFDRAIASRNNEPHHAVTVPCRTFGSILAQYGVPYYLKVDIEGADHLCVEALDPGDLPRYCSVEQSLPGVEMFTLLNHAGYDRFRVIDQTDFTELYWQPYQGEVVREALKRSLGPMSRKAALPVRAAIGMSRSLRRGTGGGTIGPKCEPGGKAGWHFNLGSSGPFGEELPGRWRSMDEAAFSWLAYCLGYASRKPGLDCWHDIHCTRGS